MVGCGKDYGRLSRRKETLWHGFSFDRQREQSGRLLFLKIGVFILGPKESHAFSIDFWNEGRERTGSNWIT